MNLDAQPGQYWRMRDGDRAQIACISVNAYDGKRYIVGWVRSNVYFWFADGRYSIHGDHAMDLIAPWTPESPLGHWIQYAMKAKERATEPAADPPETYGRPTGDALTISKQARKIDQMRRTVEHLHDRLAALQSSEKNKASQIARLKKEIADHNDFMAYMAGELGGRKCLHGDGGHESTPPMMWPELIKCIVARAVQDAKKDASAEAEPAADPWDYQPQDRELCWMACDGDRWLGMYDKCREYGPNVRFAKAEPPEVRSP